MQVKSGIILVNLGSPEAPTAKAVRKYLAQFLHDPRVIDTNRWIWCPILHGVILRVRPARSAKNYAKIWDKPKGFPGEDAPLIRITKAQVKAVQEILGETAYVDTAMRYGQPSIDLAIDRLLAKGCTHIGVLPLYPQYSTTTTASVYDGVAKALKSRVNIPSLRILRDYHNHPDYITALATSLQAHISTQGWEPDVILASFHGLPQSYDDKGDPYAGECRATTKLLRARLGFSEDKLRLTFQSRFGPKDWLRPYTDKTLIELAQTGVKNVMLITPGFAADCLETLEEINMEARHIFLSAGGEKFSLVPCLNTDPAHIILQAKLIKDQLLP